MKNKIKIFFLENSFDYNGSDLNNPKIGGSEKTLINITNQLAKDMKFEICVFNNTTKEIKINNVFWKNISSIQKSIKADFVIAMSDANLFKILNCKKNYLWSHSIQSIEKFIRKKQLIPFIKYKPTMILEGEYHYKNRNFFTSMFGKKILKLAPDFDFINTEIKKDFIPKQNAIFTTKSDRNIEYLLSSWIEIKKLCTKSKLFINPPFQLKDIHIKNNIYLRTKGDINLLIQDLKNSKLFITPGHKTEVFCLAADEARELCVPIVTMGYGCLYERVKHGYTGFIAKNKKEFIDYSSLILNDDSVYLE
ncbi:glycosyltransferase, partial [Candidatus Pelagibacter sp.]|uniref:glycosyltransferase n=1 Tax=Candidatus Pelagibacter sp. TaxID=2024849 RepID=UPI003F862679